ncbi:chemotaxis protein CheW [Enterovirga aerilata]|uniref:Chemotaxis protein CheW n=1 Tax=Enterovirga aerilata TaxID=2730920 RepID=A0A849I8C6_9HYPH|nr:chemotaxis protein CheW [Enterovirga sp. DB1703]NNM73648.1 chemotaxis protein CheW [Enterovirga sp. DB1703]
MKPLADEGQRVGPEPAEREAYVTAVIAGQLFGIPIGRVRDVFNLGGLTPVPLAPSDVLGLTNLRGRVVTVLDIHSRLGLPPHPAAQPGGLAIGIEAGEDSFGLVVDRIGEIVSVDRDAGEDNPIHLDPAWAALSRRVHRLDDGLLVVLDVDAVLEIAPVPSDIPRAPESPQ